MDRPIDKWLEEVDCVGYAILPGVFGPEEAQSILRELTLALATNEGQSASVRSQAGNVYAARNVLTLWPPTTTVWRRSPLVETLTAILGPAFGLVRTLFFDKPPERTWALPWHKDLTIAVRDNRRPSDLFAKPTCKAGVPHVEAPQEVLESMLTARIHLEDITDENGPLMVVPGSHRSGKRLALGDTPPDTILVHRGDLLLMRPLVAHASNSSHPDTQRHRPILHLEFAASPDLPDGYAWHQFIPGRVG
jgi:hypothetical protein